jgi:geranylgeranyl pyrophosphate synthase
LEDQIEQVRKVSLSVELIHNAYLIHDDLIDADESRREKPTFHVQLKNEMNNIYKNSDFSKDNEYDMYGRDLSILGGTQGYILGLTIIKDSKFPDNLKLMALNEYTSAVDYLLKGQILEEYMHYHNITMSLEQYLNIAELQKARLLEKSTIIGAILAKGNLHYQIKPLSDALLLLGQAYAIRDDLLDTREDIKNKKKKSLYILAIQNTNEEQSRILNEIYHQDGLSSSDIKDVERIFAETNALIIADHFAKNLIVQAKKSLRDIYPDLNKTQKVFFNEFTDYIYMRDF